MYHSIKFYRSEDVLDALSSNFIPDFYVKDSYKDWGLIPTVRPSVPPPSVKTRYVDVPGSDSKLDFTTSLSGYPLLENRAGSWTFMIDREHIDENWPDKTIEKTWQDLYSEIMDWLQGNQMCAVLEDDQSWYYIGRFWVSSLTSDQKYTTITISYDVRPYKRAMFIDANNEDWIWDNFDFVAGVLPENIVWGIEVNSPDEFKQIEFDTRNVNEWYNLFGREPIMPTIKISGTDQNGMILKFQNKALHRSMFTSDPLPNGIYSKIHRNVIFGGPCLEMYTSSADYIDGYHIGDVNLDHKVTASDAALTLKIYTEFSENKSIEDLDFLDEDMPTRLLQCNLADFNRDGKVNAVDASGVLRYYSDMSSGDYVEPSGSGSLYANSTLDIRVKGVGTISFIFRPGRL